MLYMGDPPFSGPGLRHVGGVTIRPYAESDLWLLERTLGDPAQMTHLNGPETAEAIRKRHRRFMAMSANPQSGLMFTILAGADNAPAGNVGYWESEWKGEAGWEMGWFVLPEFQRRGIATAASRLVVEQLSILGSHRVVFAFPSVDNVPSNAICRTLRFGLEEEVSSEYPPGSGRQLHVNVWKLSLRPAGSKATSRRVLD